ncbi:hypothetical protein [Pseudomonas japonica]|uniref:hypothetical protein n=1 Tax=Pseudomonas japonica TaxID=256466 RepID=UPI0005AA83BF|nr:hypothetical protein [Pseudomonas japonica]
MLIAGLPAMRSVRATTHSSLSQILSLNGLRQRHHQRLSNLQRLLGGPEQIAITVICQVAHLGIGFDSGPQRAREVRQGVFDIGAVTYGE